MMTPAARLELQGRIREAAERRIDFIKRRNNALMVWTLARIEREKRLIDMTNNEAEWHATGILPPGARETDLRWANAVVDDDVAKRAYDAIDREVSNEEFAYHDRISAAAMLLEYPEAPEPGDPHGARESGGGP